MKRLLFLLLGVAAAVILVPLIKYGVPYLKGEA